jgi:RPM1-interacting protein 4
VQKRPTVPKFGAWSSDNAGYTVYFDKVRKNKGATAPQLQHQPYNPEDGPLAVSEAVDGRRAAERADPHPPAGREQQQRAGR